MSYEIKVGLQNTSHEMSTFIHFNICLLIQFWMKRLSICTWDLFQFFRGMGTLSFISWCYLPSCISVKEVKVPKKSPVYCYWSAPAAWLDPTHYSVSKTLLNHCEYRQNTLCYRWVWHWCTNGICYKADHVQICTQPSKNMLTCSTWLKQYSVLCRRRFCFQYLLLLRPSWSPAPQARCHLKQVKMSDRCWGRKTRSTVLPASRQKGCPDQLGGQGWKI